MTEIEARGRRSTVTATANPEKGAIVASADFHTSPERLFRALISEEICKWWVRPGVFNTQQWSADLRKGGRWAAAGMGGGKPYKLEGEFLTIDEPRRLAQTWIAAGAPGDPAMLIYDLERQPDGVRLILRHTGLMTPELCERTRAGWETSLARLQEIIAAEKG